MPVVDGRESAPAPDGGVGGDFQLVVRSTERRDAPAAQRRRSRRDVHRRGAPVVVVAVEGQGRSRRGSRGTRRENGTRQAGHFPPVQHDELHHALRPSVLQRLRLLLRFPRLGSRRRLYRQVNYHHLKPVAHSNWFSLPSSCCRKHDDCYGNTPCRHQVTRVLFQFTYRNAYAVFPLSRSSTLCRTNGSATAGIRTAVIHRFPF